MKLALAGTCVALLVVAQSFEVTLNGSVTDLNGAAVSGAAIQARNIQTGFNRSTQTDEEGRFTLLNLPAGSYEIDASKAGFNREVRKDQLFFVGTTVTLNFQLQLSSVNESVTIVTEAPVIETSKNVLARTVEFSEIDRLPVINRSFSDLAALAPGVVRTAGGLLNISGSRSFNNSVQLDGLSAERQSDGAQRVLYAQDWIQEFQVLTSQYSAEFGQAEGGVLNVITRSGTNVMHGRLYSFLRNDAWEAIPALTTVKPPLDEKRIGAALGGPVRKDRLFYFLGYEWLLNQSSTIVSTPFPSLNGPVPNDTRRHLYLAKLDYRPADRHAVSLRYNVQRGGQTNTGIGGALTAENGGPIQLRASDYTASWTATFSPRSLNDLRLAFADWISDRGCNFARNNPNGPWFARTYGGAILGCPTNVGAITFGRTGEDQVQIIDNFSRVSGRHDWKAGVQIFRNRVYTDFPQTPSYLFGTAAYPFTLDNPNSYPIGFQWIEGGDRFDVATWSYGCFLQDSWRLRPNFTLNAGLRYDIDGTFSALNRLVPPGRSWRGPDTDFNNLAPRAGFAWTPSKSRRTVIRGGAGLFYDQNHNLSAVGMLQFGVLPERLVSINATNALLNPFWPDIARARRILAEALAANRLPDPSLLAAIANSTAQPDRDLSIPYTVQASVGIAHQLRRGLSLAADYVYSRGIDQYIGRDANVDPVTFGRIDPKYSQNLAYGNAGFTRYHGLQTQLTWTPRSDYLFKLSYTLSSSRSNTSTLLNGPPATNPLDFSEDEGPNDNDARHVLNLNSSTTLPWGVQLAGILSYSSALPYSALSNAPRPDGKPFTFFWRPEPRNARRGDSFVSLDVRAGKSFRFGDKVRITGFIEGFNLTNAVNFISYNGTAGSPTFGQANMAGPKRRMQLGFRLDF